MGSSVDAMRKEFLAAEPALKRLDLEMERMKFNPRLPASVDAARAKVSKVIERLMGDFKGNPVLGPLTEELKSQYLESIKIRVANAKRAA